jgi:hypothetical protein
MSLVLNDNMSIFTVQQLFNSVFPYLKIDFFERDTKLNGFAFVRKHVTGNAKKLKDYKIANTKEPLICIKPSLTVSDLDKIFSKTYYLQTQVFRKSGNVWLEATITDGWSLEDQNKQGELICAQMTKR